MNKLKMLWLNIQIICLKPLVYIESLYNKYKDWQLRLYVASQCGISSIEIIKQELQQKLNE